MSRRGGSRRFGFGVVSRCLRPLYGVGVCKFRALEGLVAAFARHGGVGGGGEGPADKRRGEGRDGRTRDQPTVWNCVARGSVAQAGQRRQRSSLRGRGQRKAMPRLCSRGRRLVDLCCGLRIERPLLVVLLGRTRVAGRVDEDVVLFNLEPNSSVEHVCGHTRYPSAKGGQRCYSYRTKFVEDHGQGARRPLERLDVSFARVATSTALHWIARPACWLGVDR
mmetsp:Transcript_89108/g.231134  ORF Transcript_89108/g.231134 Transcript_89108/m.231134 type:complete len:222 (+) Transcript_89108:2845-3510(+)